MKKLLLLFAPTLYTLISFAQSDTIKFEGFKNGNPINLKQITNAINQTDSIVINIKGKKGVSYSTDGFTAEYFRISDSKEMRQQKQLKKIFHRILKLNSNKIEFKVQELLVGQDLISVEIVLNKISYWDNETNKWIEIPMHPSKRTFKFAFTGN